MSSENALVGGGGGPGRGHKVGHVTSMGEASDCVLRWTQLIVKCVIKYSEHSPAEHDGGTPADLLTLPFYLSFPPLFQSKLPQASPLSPLAFPHCLQAPIQRLEQYCEALEELGGINPASDSALSILRHAQRHGEDLRASDLIVGCPVRMLVPVYVSATVKSHFLFLERKKLKSCWGQASGSDLFLFYPQINQINVLVFIFHTNTRNTAYIRHVSRRTH